jgi:hypothetical protein
MNSFYLRLTHHIKHKGPFSLFRAGIRNIVERINPPRAESLQTAQKIVAGKAGFEIGGPSRVFSDLGLLPLYDTASRIDNCNFGDHTIWEGVLEEGQEFRYRNGPVLGTQYIRDAVDLVGIRSSRYDFILSAYMIQHSANPLRALHEWMRILREGGSMILLVPHKERTFDRRRPLTSLEHLIDDHERNTGEDDQTHISEVLELHDLSRDALAGSYGKFERRTLNNPKNRAVHQHVFDVDLVVKMIDHLHLQVVNVETIRPDNIIVICDKVSHDKSVDNSGFYSNNVSYEF